MIENESRSTVSVVITGSSSGLLNRQSKLVVIGMLVVPQVNVNTRPRPTPVMALLETCCVTVTFRRLFPISAIPVSDTVMLALAFTVTLMLVPVSVGVLPTLLFVTVIPVLSIRRCLISVSPLVGAILLRILLTFSLCFIVPVAVRLLFAVTMTCKLVPCRAVTVLGSAGPTGLPIVSSLVSRLLMVRRTMSVLSPCKSLVVDVSVFS